MQRDQERAADRDTRGTFWFGYDVDARTTAAGSGSAKSSKGAVRLSPQAVDRKLAKSGHSRQQAVAKVTTGTL